MIDEILPGGSYWIGDPCYPFPHEGPQSELWREILSKTNCFNANTTNTCTINNDIVPGVAMWVGGTSYGDGSYQSNPPHNINFGVDSGMLCIMTLDTIKYLGSYNNEFLKSLGHFITFEGPFRVMIRNGIFKFGDIIINTCYQYDEDDEE